MYLMGNMFLKIICLCLSEPPMLSNYRMALWSWGRFTQIMPWLPDIVHAQVPLESEGIYRQFAKLTASSKIMKYHVFTNTAHTEFV